MTYDIETVELPERPAAVVRGQVAHDGIPGFLAQAFGEVVTTVGPRGLGPAGPAFARYRPTEDGGWDIEAGFTLLGALDGASGRVEPTTLPAGEAARTVHVGDYGGLGAAYEAVGAWLAEHGLVAAGDPWECYLDGPEVEHPRTEVYFPCRAA
jgi:effector-binding domain-containing protein